MIARVGYVDGFPAMTGPLETEEDWDLFYNPERCALTDACYAGDEAAKQILLDWYTDHGIQLEEVK